MNNPNNLFNMMQTGGLTSTAGGTALARAFQRKRDMERLEEIQRAEAKRQKRGGLFGSVLSTVGGLLGGAIGGTAGAAIGSGLGRRAGEGLGAGKSRKYSTEGTVFGQQAFRDVSQASRDYTRGMGSRAFGSALQAGSTAGLTRGGGIYGQYNPFTSEGQFGLKSLMRGTGVSGYSGTQNLLNFSTPNYIQDIPRISPLDSSPVMSSLNTVNRLPLNFEDGGYTGYQDGGFTAKRVLQEAGFEPTEQQLGLFQQFDPGEIERAKERTEQSLLSMTGGMGLSSLGGGFGARQRAATSAIGKGEDLIGDTAEQAQRDFESQTLGTMADLVAGGAEFGENPGTNPDDFTSGVGVENSVSQPLGNPPSGWTGGSNPSVGTTHTDSFGSQWQVVLNPPPASNPVWLLVQG